LPTSPKATLLRYYSERLDRPFIITDKTPIRKEGAPPWVAPIAHLTRGNAAQRTQGGLYLRDLVAQALKDENLAPRLGGQHPIGSAGPKTLPKNYGKALRIK
jgi:hypothetical protein